MCVFGIVFSLAYRRSPLVCNSIKSLIIPNCFFPSKHQPGIQPLLRLDKQVWSTVEWPIKTPPILSTILTSISRTEPLKSSANPSKTLSEERGTGCFFTMAMEGVLMGSGVCRDCRVNPCALVIGVDGRAREGVYNLGSAMDARLTPKRNCRCFYVRFYAPCGFTFSSWRLRQGFFFMGHSYYWDNPF